MGLLLLDLDGTIVEPALEEWTDGTKTKLVRRQHELYTEPTLMANVYDVLQRAAEEGDSFAIATNQGGVAWGYHTRAEVHRRISNTLARLDFFWGQPFSVFVAFMDPRATIPGFKGDDGRKPAPTMLLEAIGKHDAPHPTLMVGDEQTDREAAEAAGVEFATAGDFFGW